MNHKWKLKHVLEDLNVLVHSGIVFHFMNMIHDALDSFNIQRNKTGKKKCIVGRRPGWIPTLAYVLGCAWVGNMLNLFQQNWNKFDEVKNSHMLCNGVMYNAATC